MRETYTVTTRATGSTVPDVVTYSTPSEAINAIQKARVYGEEVTYTGDPFADLAAGLEW